MAKTTTVQYHFDTLGFRRFIGDWPKEVNKAVNYALKVGGGKFSQHFAKSTPVVSRKTGKLGRSRRGQPTVAAKVRRLGFKVVILRLKTLNGKALIAHTRNPQAITLEEGDTIHAKRAPYLMIHPRTQAAAKMGGVSTGGKSGRKISGVRFRKKSVRIPPQLGFEKAWDSYLPTLVQKVDEGWERGVKWFKANQAKAK